MHTHAHTHTSRGVVAQDPVSVPSFLTPSPGERVSGVSKPVWSLVGEPLILSDH